ncbi:amino acid-binding ACT domain protein [Caldalkalibacillus thermarum TA2.A1]|uniref:Amino acid-binding ACT domain protein n=1 Tax=Caldalkalibacillus thermarum (strain TA2.A1) TaxID=986075 RepID=F5L9R9_CALTT|nr:DUF3388 domain-containing protein [Caldalkalibacillus thermarum]EGL81918.1 amino acid-binding ACT domain protein [Caldalkalibacillus thermarum TA2.A1]QZT32961.1 DUF3388 domain-containing protein [Caldalkalibacillus thermarum TA2.A1]
MLEGLISVADEKPEKKEWYLEYLIHENRPGLLGDISSLLGMLKINIITINGVDLNRRGMILESDDDERIELLRSLLERVNNISITKLRHPHLRDRLAVRHGRYISRDADDKKTFRFVRDEIGVLVDFLAEIFKKEGHQLIGIRGRPRVGKTESIVASSVCANKRWSFVSSTLLKQTIRSQMADDELSPDHVFIIDGIVSTTRAPEQHQTLLREVLRLDATKVVEHPDIFVRYTEYSLEDFDYIIELRNYENEEMPYDIDPQISNFNSDWR